MVARCSGAQGNSGGRGRAGEKERHPEEGELHERKVAVGRNATG